MLVNDPSIEFVKLILIVAIAMLIGMAIRDRFLRGE
jgi:hypothetical protein